MKLIRKIYGIIQPHIVTMFSLLLLVAFALVVIVFNVSVRTYISSSARFAVEEVRANHFNEETRNVGIILQTLRGNHRFVSNVRIYETDENFVPLSEYPSPGAKTISTILNYSPLVDAGVIGFVVDGRAYYVSVISGESGVTIFYLEITDTLTFTTVVFMLLMISAVMIWMFSTVVAGILADFMMRPLRVLRDFVRQLGRGDFTPNSHSFANEEFDELNQSLNHAARQLHAYDNEQKTFFQNVSHELRTPLTIIKMYAEGIQQGVMDKTAADTILEATNNLAEMVGDILYISRLDNVAAPIKEEVDLCVMVKERINRQRSIAKSNGVKIECIFDDDSIIIDCSMKYFERALDNLISNAIRYAKSSMTVECFAIGANATVRITDDGQGFEENALPHVFERFYRGKNGLTGIGLSTVKSIVDQHKGTATAENAENGGAVLTISIPRKK
ncbi:MAG: HAMP domain-containing histidine kinase [Defluviitaleaceae bacterium]|nr:HAMP domain-containing histidine kinase [Defluviitaleaceae bacterium]